MNGAFKISSKSNKAIKIRHTIAALDIVSKQSTSCKKDHTVVTRRLKDNKKTTSNSAKAVSAKCAGYFARP